MGILEKVQPIEVMLPERYQTMSTLEMEERVREIKGKMGALLFIPGHHYQKDEVVQFSDAAGDSLQLAQVAANNKEAKYIVFCGVHFMAETADMLTTDDQLSSYQICVPAVLWQIWQILNKQKERGKSSRNYLGIR